MLPSQVRRGTRYLAPACVRRLAGCLFAGSPNKTTYPCRHTGHALICSAYTSLSVRRSSERLPLCRPPLGSRFRVLGHHSGFFRSETDSQQDTYTHMQTHAAGLKTVHNNGRFAILQAPLSRQALDSASTSLSLCPVLLVRTAV
jgi:hypothetical protein